MNRRLRAARFCFAIAALCFLVLSAQYFRLALQLARAEADGRLLSPVAAASALPKPAGVPPAQELKRLLLGGTREPDALTPSAGASVKALVYVSSDGPRAAVFVNGRAVGHTPYLGDLDCTAGERVKIELLPPKGAPSRREVTCASEIRVSSDSSP